MGERKSRRIWVAVRVWRGFISDVRAYSCESSAKRQAASWRRRINPDYDEVDVASVTVRETRKTSSRC